MALAIIKKAYLGKRVAFGASGKPLGERDDIDELAIIARQSSDSSLIMLFELPMPSLADLKKSVTDAQLAKLKKPEAAKAVGTSNEAGANPLNKPAIEEPAGHLAAPVLHPKKSHSKKK